MPQLSTAVRTSSSGSSTLGTSLLGWFVAICIGLAIGAYGYLPPANNLVNTGWDSWKAAAGYALVDPKHPRKGASWQPGTAHPSRPHVHAADEEKRWSPDEGYNWKGTTLDEGVQWQPGQRHAAFANIAAAADEGTWQPDPGYAYTTPGKVSAAQWTPGLEHRELKNVVAVAQENRWTTRPGYRFSKPDTLSAAVWTPGAAHPNFEHILAGERADTWVPEPGYERVSQEPGDLRVVAIQSAVNEPPQDRGSQFVKGFFKFVLGGSMAGEESGDGIMARKFGRPLAGTIRDSGLRDMIGAISRR